jgi:hypothetical protein
VFVYSRFLTSISLGRILNPLTPVVELLGSDIYIATITIQDTSLSSRRLFKWHLSKTATIFVHSIPNTLPLYPVFHYRGETAPSQLRQPLPSQHARLRHRNCRSAREFRTPWAPYHPTPVRRLLLFDHFLDLPLLGSLVSLPSVYSLCTLSTPLRHLIGDEQKRPLPSVFQHNLTKPQDPPIPPSPCALRQPLDIQIEAYSKQTNFHQPGCYRGHPNYPQCIRGA